VAVLQIINNKCNIVALCMSMAVNPISYIVKCHVSNPFREETRGKNPLGDFDIKMTCTPIGFKSVVKRITHL
jgi:hypothetical protein